MTIHDLIFDHYKTGKASTLPRWFYVIKKIGYHIVLWTSVKRATKILTLSQDAKNEIVDHYHAFKRIAHLDGEGLARELFAAYLELAFPIPARVLRHALKQRTPSGLPQMEAVGRYAADEFGFDWLAGCSICEVDNHGESEEHEFGFFFGDVVFKEELVPLPNARVHHLVKAQCLSNHSSLAHVLACGQVIQSLHFRVREVECHRALGRVHCSCS